NPSAFGSGELKQAMLPHDDGARGRGLIVRPWRWTTQYGHTLWDFWREFRIPANTTITDIYLIVASEISITPISSQLLGKIGGSSQNALHCGRSRRRETVPVVNCILRRGTPTLPTGRKAVVQ